VTDWVWIDVYKNKMSTLKRMVVGEVTASKVLLTLISASTILYDTPFPSSCRCFQKNKELQHMHINACISTITLTKVIIIKQYTTLRTTFLIIMWSLNKIGQDKVDVNGQHVSKRIIFQEIKSHNPGTTEVKIVQQYTNTQNSLLNNHDQNCFGQHGG